MIILCILNSCRENEVKKIELNPIENPELITKTDARELWQKPELIIQLMGDLDGHTIADIGAGTGYFTFKLLDRAKKVIAIEIDNDMIQLMNSLVNTYSDSLVQRFEARLALPNDPKLGKEEVDDILIVNTIAYISNRVDYFKNLLNSLSSNGKIYIIDYKVKRLPIVAPDYEDRVHMHILEEQLDSAGFQKIFIDDTSLDFQYIIEASKN